MASPWPRVLLLYATGLVAAAQLGKLSSLAPLLVADLGLRLTTMAWTISLLELGGAVGGALAGALAQRWGLVRALRWGVVALALAGAGQALAGSAVGLIGWRLLEAGGYLAVIVTAPVLLARQAAAAGVRTQGLALTLWSTFVPVGLACGAAGAAALAQAGHWRWAPAAGAVLAALVAAWLWRVPLRDEPPVTATATADAPAAASQAAWALALGFGLYALFAIGMLALLPLLLVQQVGLGPAAAGAWTGVISASGLLGSLLAALLVRRGVAARWPLLLGLAMPGALLPGVFAPAPALGWAIGLSLLIHVLGGLYASLAFAQLPRVAGGHAGLVRANGLVAQCGASGSLLGPPAMAACVQWGGWPAAAGLGLLVSALALPLTWRATRPGDPH